MAAVTRKVLVPLATALAAGAIAVGSGATFASQSGNTLSAVTSGTLTQLNSKADSAIFQLTDVKPGDTLHGNLSVTNTGSLPARFSLVESSSTNEFAGDNLTLTITNTTTGDQVYAGSFGGLADGEKNDLGVVRPGVRNDFRFTVELAEDAPNTEQGKAAGATYQWSSVQLDTQQ
jgi:spore coat-associated protein N